jgi:two-component sensor histidine kinase/low affinity Fe/Cu permease
MLPPSKQGSHALGPSAPRGAKGWSLRTRLLVAVTVALLPIAIASFLQGLDRVERDTRDIRAQLVQITRASASREENLLASAEQITRALANMPAVRHGGAGCSLALSDALRNLSFFTNLARVDAQGYIVCSARPVALGGSRAARAVFRRAQTARKFVLSDQIINPLDHQPVILGMLPLISNDHFTGVIAISIDTHWLEYMVRAKHLPPNAVVAIFDAQRNIIAANNPAVAQTLFTRAVARHSTGTDLFTAHDRTGQTWLYSTAALLGSRVYVGFAMPQSQLFGATYVHVGTDFVLPFIMIALTWIAIWMVTEQQVTRWIIYLRRVAAAYRSGHYALRPSLRDAPSEFHMLGDAMAEMADAIQDRDHRLRDALQQKSLLVREIHHRVKNNLQIVMSLLSLQAGRVENDAARSALMQARARINALALVHRILHDIEELATVELRTLLTDLAAQIHEGFALDSSTLRLEIDAISCQVSGDLAVPLALFTVEALTNVFKHAYPDRTLDGVIRVSLRSAGADELSLAIIDNGRGFNPEASGASVGDRLMRTFALQVGGRIYTRSNRGHGTTVELVFPDPNQPKKDGKADGVPPIATSPQDLSVASS